MSLIKGEKEVKDKKWLKEQVHDLFHTACQIGKMEYHEADESVNIINEFIDQLDEPEVKRLERKIKKLDSYNDELIRDNNQLRNELDNQEVLSQELPVIPKFVAEHIENRRGESLAQAYNIPTLTKVGKWLLDKENCETFARAWLDGFMVEEEQKYYVLNNEKYFLLGKDKGHGFIFSTGGNSKLGSVERASATFELTEQEIKDYDERYWPFAVKVEELE